MIGLGWTVVFWTLLGLISLFCLACMLSGGFYRRIFKSSRFMRGARCGFVLVLYIIVKVFVGDICEVKGASMKNTLFNGDYVLVSKLAYGGRLPASLKEIPIVNLLLYIYPFSLLENQSVKKYTRLYSSKSVQRGEIVVSNIPVYHETFCIKRCVALAGDRLDTLRINGTALSGRVPYQGMAIQDGPIDSLEFTTRQILRFYYPDRIRNDTVSRFSLGDDFIYLVGDNYAASSDSRMWGPVKTDHIVGKVIKIFPKNKK